MTPPAWTRNKSKYKVHRKPDGSANVIHFSPSKKKVTIRVPKSKASNIPAFLKNYYGPPKNVNIRRLSNGRVAVTKNHRTAFLPLKNPSQGNINMFINAHFKALPSLLKNRPMMRANFFKNVTNNGRTGTALTSLNKNGGLRTIYNVSKGKKSVHLGIAKLGGGEQAVVYLGYFDVAATKPVSLKVFPFDRSFPASRQPCEIEFSIGNKLHAIVPRHVPKYISIEKAMEFVPKNNLTKLTGPLNTSHQTVILSEYFHGGDFRTWISKVSSRLKENDMIDIIRQVLETLIKIREKYPGFRHNDLHSRNVFIDDTGIRPRAAIADFGLARLSPELSNPIVNSGMFINSGIGPSTDSRYDAHMFLNGIRHLCSPFPRLMLFMNMAIPVGYRGNNDTYVKDARLKYGLPDYPRLPSTRVMLRMLLPIVSAKNLAQAIANLKKAKPITTSNKPIVGSDAANVAKSALKNLAGVSVTKVTTINPTAKNFMKMSPTSKATYLASKKPVVKKPTVLTFKKTTGNATASKKTNAGAFLKIALEKKAPSPPKPVLKPAKNLLNSATKNKNVNAVTVRQLRAVLERYGYAQNNAKREARTWANAWVNRVAKRRTNLKLAKGNNGRVRSGKKLLEGYKKDELVAMARRHGLATSGKTKDQLITLLWKA
jgi:hypothetical protein